MNTSKSLILMAPLLALLLAGGANAARDPADPFKDWKGDIQSGEFQYDDSQDKPWQESAVEIPPLPGDDDLLPVRLDNLPPGMSAHLGASSLSFEPSDRVLRYWLVITSPAGAYNASYEGLRCATEEYKVYAYGNRRREPAVRAMPNAAWQRMKGLWRSDYRAEMAQTLMCGEALRPRKVRDILATLRGQSPYRNPAADNEDF